MHIILKYMLKWRTIMFQEYKNHGVLYMVDLDIPNKMELRSKSRCRLFVGYIEVLITKRGKK